jgi:hypothetical protein
MNKNKQEKIEAARKIIRDAIVKLDDILDNVENELDNAFINVDEVCDNMQLKLTRLSIRYDKDNNNLFKM